MEANDKTDKITYAPFILMDGKYRSLFLTDMEMEKKVHIFDERSDEGWTGGGYDWNSLAQVIVDEQLSDLKPELSFDPEAGTFSASGPREALERLGKAMCAVFHNDDSIRDLLTRAKLD